MNNFERVRASLKWKKSDEICAKKLSLTLSQYKQIKSQIKGQNIIEDVLEDKKADRIIDYKEFVESGTAEIKAISTTEPRSAEDIELLLKLDKTKWKLSSYWNKEQGDRWLVSAQVSRLKTDPIAELKSVLEDIKLEYTPITSVPLINEIYADKTCAVLSLQDLHVGKETLDGIHDIKKSVQDCVINLVSRAYHSSNLDKIVLVLGGDLVNMDTYLGTTTSGTPIDNSMPAYDAYKLAFDIMHWTVMFTKQFCNELEVVYIPGNHSRLTEAHIAYSLSKCILDPNITWNIEYAERKVVMYGTNMLCLEHGDFDTKKSFYVFATEFPKEWGAAETRVLYTGHYHKEKTIQYITRDETNGFTIKILPSLSKTDKYHYSNKWTSNKRSGIIELYSIEGGCTGAFQYNDK